MSICEDGAVDAKRTDLNASHRDHPDEDAEAVGHHVGLEGLIAYCEGRLTAAEREDLQEHLSLCARCTALLRELYEFASDSDQRGLTGPERLEQEAWESLVQRRAVAERGQARER